MHRWSWVAIVRKYLFDRFQLDVFTFFLLSKNITYEDVYLLQFISVGQTLNVKHETWIWKYESWHMKHET